MNHRDQLPMPWHKSSYSGGVNNCVEVAALPTGAAVRDSQHPTAGHLTFPGSEWGALLGAVRNDQL